MSASTNLDIRFYAAAHDVRLQEIARKLGMSPSAFSTAYMRTEQSRNTKETLKRLIREIEAEKGARDEAEKVQA